jgi:hypothetical protein
VRLSEIGRALEETIALAKTQTRLSRNLGRPELRAHLGTAVLRAGGVRIAARRLLVLDISDIAKPYAEKRQDQFPNLHSHLAMHGRSIHRRQFGLLQPGERATI